MKYLMVLLVSFFSLTVFGQESQSVATDWIDKIMALIPTDATVLAGIAALIEILFRYIPSEKPMSLFYAIAEFCRHMAQLMVAVAQFLDKVIGQKVPQKPAQVSKYYNPPSK
jgi:hypothetical protein